MIIRREADDDADVIRGIVDAAFDRSEAPGRETVEARLVDELRVGHVLCTRAHVGDVPVLALGPLSVRPGQQRSGVGSALMHTAIGAGDAIGEPMVVLLGDLRLLPPVRVPARLGLPDHPARGRLGAAFPGPHARQLPAVDARRVPVR
jgi:putative acetyltransferase